MVLIKNCTNDRARISGWQNVGGICGDSGLGDIIECTNDFDVEVVNVTGNMAGGICGYFSTSQHFKTLDKASTISGCVNSGDVNAPQGTNKSEFTGSQIGGICGYAEDNMILPTNKIAPIRITNSLTETSKKSPILSSHSVNGRRWRDELPELQEEV